MPPRRESGGITGVNRDVFQGFFCSCGNDAFVELTRRAADYGAAVANAFGTNQRIWCPKCHKFYTFRDGVWVDTTPITLPKREPKPERVAAIKKTQRRQPDLRHRDANS